MWKLVVSNRDDKDKAQIISKLYTPLPGQTMHETSIESGPWSDEEMAASFRATQINLSGKSGIK